jgi:hypothetical protein
MGSSRSGAPARGLGTVLERTQEHGALRPARGRARQLLQVSQLHRHHESEEARSEERTRGSGGRRGRSPAAVAGETTSGAAGLPSRPSSPAESTDTWAESRRLAARLANHAAPWGSGRCWPCRRRGPSRRCAPTGAGALQREPGSTASRNPSAFSKTGASPPVATTGAGVASSSRMRRTSPPPGAAYPWKSPARTLSSVFRPITRARLPQVHPGKTGRLLEEGVGGDAQARGDGAAQVLAARPPPRRRWWRCRNPARSRGAVARLGGQAP